MTDDTELGDVTASAANTRHEDASTGRRDVGDHTEDDEVDVERATGKGTPRSEDDPELASTFQEAVEEGTLRLRRDLSTLLSTGLVGGIDLSIGVIALLVVKHATDNELLAALAFTIGFIALTLARSELLTENFLVPVSAVIARQARVRELLRLWAGTGVTNLVGGWVVMGLLIAGLPELGDSAVKISELYTDELGIGWRSFSLALLGGAVITVMTWMERNCETQGPKIVAAVAASFVLAAAPLNHVIVSSLEMFAALHHGAPFGYLQYLGVAAWALLGNMIGGLLLVTLVRLVQIGRGPIERARRVPYRRLQPAAADGTRGAADDGRE